MVPVPVMRMVVYRENGTDVIEYEEQFSNRFGMDCMFLYRVYYNKCNRLSVYTFTSSLLLNGRYCLY